MQFRIGDKVREGLRVGTVTDVGTVLIEVKTTAGTSRMVCPWELVMLRASSAPGSAPTARQTKAVSPKMTRPTTG